MGAKVKAGDKVPSATFFEKDLNTKVSSDDVFKGKKVVVFGIPGAFTPTCTKKHVPGYVNNIEQFHSKGVDEVVCLAVNDPYVMDAFCDKYGCTGKVRGLTDVKGEFVKKLGLDIDMTEKLGGVRSQRFAMFVDDGVIKEVLTEDDGTSLSNSSAENMLKKIAA